MNTNPPVTRPVKFLLMTPIGKPTVGLLVAAALSIASCTTLPDRPVAVPDRQVHVTVDFNDDFRGAGGPVGRANVDAQMARFSELGIERVYWIHHAQDLFLPRPLVEPDADLLAIAVDAAHRHGMELYALFKPFETGFAGPAFPPPVVLSEADRSGALQSIGGVHPMIAPFVRDHPELRLRRRAVDPLMGRGIDRIKLVKEDDEPTRLRREHLQVFTADRNGIFHPYDGAFDFSDGVEIRNGRRMRVLTLSGLDLPLSARFVLVRSRLADRNGDFRNLEDRMMELYDREGYRLPATIDEGQLTRDQLIKNLGVFFLLRHGRSRIPADTVPDDYGTSPERTAFHFDIGSSGRPRVLDGTGRRNGIIVAARGHNTHTVGALHPAYPEVREYWRNEILTRCVDAGVDGVAIRVANHSSWTSEGAMFGFNPPAVEAYRQLHGDGPIDEHDSRWRRLQGAFFTRFLRELKQDLVERDVRLQVSINHLMLKSRPGWRKNNVPQNFSYEWETWITEGISDSIELKYFPWPFGGQRDPGMELVPKIIDLARAHGQPVYLNVRFDTGIPWREVFAEDDPSGISMRDPRLGPLRAKLRNGWDQPHLNGVILYEGASFTRMVSGTGETKVAPFVKDLLDEIRDPRP